MDVASAMQSDKISRSLQGRSSLQALKQQALSQGITSHSLFNAVPASSTPPQSLRLLKEQERRELDEAERAEACIANDVLAAKAEAGAQALSQQQADCAAY